ncbi:hypothetical protein [Streptomyces zhihengii]|uniref:Uncharacterized protein n=1 Tax=Streptomyces zhihengii TaxID=1818004 RepID=A0ABS2UTV0_9ACTN|nr:hypothetical protein [Streptomyces zhihengii]MBM9620986.1 hypothetical protein [Streptomyces zhihengii]
MTASDAGEVDALVRAARDMLRRGSPVDAFVGLVPAAGARGALVAVREALGMSRAEAGEPWWFGGVEDLEAGEERFAGELLEAHGAFDVPRAVSARGAEARRWMEAAMRASGGIASGRAVGVIRALKAGWLDKAFVGLAAVGPRSGGDAAVFWRSLVAAGELLVEDGADVGEALERCRRGA